jgi:hypothetical protein
MSIIRIKKNKNFSVISNVGLRDNRLSLKAKGIYAYLLSLPDDWKVYISELSKHSTDGITATTSGVNELIKCGYIERNILKDSKGKFSGYEYIITECPKSGFPISGNLKLPNTNGTKERKEEEEKLKKKPPPPEKVPEVETFISIYSSLFTETYGIKPEPITKYGYAQVNNILSVIFNLWIEESVPNIKDKEGMISYFLQHIFTTEDYWGKKLRHKMSISELSSEVMLLKLYESARNKLIKSIQLKSA